MATSAKNWAVALAALCAGTFAMGCTTSFDDRAGPDAGSDILQQPEADVVDALPDARPDAAPCGNGAIDPGEECDGTNLNGKTCRDVSSDFTGGELACASDCTFLTSACIRRGCGNGVIDEGEECDDQNTTPGDGCGADCQVESGWRCSGQPSQCERTCGNGVADLGEECDGQDLRGQDCTTVPGGFAAGTLTCTQDCHWDTTGCRKQVCGDKHQDPPEQCDDGNQEDGDGCAHDCTREDFSVLYRFVQNAWDAEEVHWKNAPSAPRAHVVAAVELPSRGTAYAFTQTTYHVLAVPSLSWTQSGPISSLLPEVSGSMTGAYCADWPDRPYADCYFVVGVHFYNYHFHRDTGTFEFNQDADIDWSDDGPAAPSDPASVVAYWVDLDNTNDWYDANPQQICGGTHTREITYLGVLTSNGWVHLYESTDCWTFHDKELYGQYPPFGVTGAPQYQQVTAAFYVSPILYVFANP